MSDIFATTDPRGFTVVCSDEVWKWHILSNRPFMQGWEAEVEAAIQQPTFGIFQDANRPERNIYYRRSEGKQRYIKVVVEFTTEHSGTVITAFPTDSMKAGEKLIWTRSSD
jgi:hypothetical protein